jgi:zinc-ribbon domain
MNASSEKAGSGQPTGRYDIWIMVTGVVMFLLSFAPWEGLNPETLGNLGGLGLGGIGNLGGLGNVPLIPGSTYNAWQVGFAGWLPCLVALAIAGVVAVQDFSGVHVPGVAGARPRFLLQVVTAISMLMLSVRAISLFASHNPNVGQARWGVYLAFVVGVTQFAFVIWGRKKIGQVTASPGRSGSPGPERASSFCTQCGTPAVAGDNFCQQCGAAVKTEPAAIGEAVPPAAEVTRSLRAAMAPRPSRRRPAENSRARGGAPYRWNQL